MHVCEYTVWSCISEQTAVLTTAVELLVNNNNNIKLAFQF
jgi:hypothetical protein